MNHSNNWLLLGTSAIGKSHVKSHTPCQDNHYIRDLEKGWGIAIVCDGAGSARNSHIGSKVVAKTLAPEAFEELIVNDWQKNNYIPGEDEWKSISLAKLKGIRLKLEDYSAKNALNLDSLACTIIVLIYSPHGLLTSHIGDGRAGYCNQNAEWKPLMIPHKGEEANLTIFITSDAWIFNPSLRMSDVTVPESRIVHEKAIAFTLLSDGCEQHSFECSKFDRQTNQWSDPNRPYPNFFTPLIQSLKTKYEARTEEINEMWDHFIESGTNGLKEELDDKTMIVGIVKKED